MGTPQGFNHFYERFNKTQEEADWEAFSSPRSRAETSLGHVQKKRKDAYVNRDSRFGGG